MCAWLNQAIQFASQHLVSTKLFFEYCLGQTQTKGAHEGGRGAVFPGKQVALPQAEQNYLEVGLKIYFCALEEDRETRPQESRVLPALRFPGKVDLVSRVQNF